MATNPPPKNAPPQQGGGNILTKKFGPLPGWGWLVVALVGFYLYRKVSGSSSASTAATQGVAPSTETVTTPGGTYTGPAQGGIPQSILNPGAPTPGNPSTPTSPSPITPTPTSSPPPTAPSTSGGWVEISDPNVVQQDISSGVPVYYEPAGGATPTSTPPQQVSQPGGTGGEWYVGGNPLPPGAGGTIWTNTPAGSQQPAHTQVG